MVRYNEDVDKDSCQVMGQGCQQLEKGIIIDTVLEIKDIKKSHFSLTSTSKILKNCERMVLEYGKTL